MVRTAVGYSGGTTDTPNYHKIGDHSEVIRIEFNPREITYPQLLEVFWQSHDPGYEVPLRQYRNAVFYLNEGQKDAAVASRQRFVESSGRKVLTEIAPAGEFYLAEDYHQKYLLRKATGIFQEIRTHYPEDTSLVVSTAAARINGYLGCNGDAADLEKEIGRLGLSVQMQARLVEHVSSACENFSSLTCPVK